MFGPAQQPGIDLIRFAGLRCAVPARLHGEDSKKSTTVWHGRGKYFSFFISICYMKAVWLRKLPARALPGHFPRKRLAHAPFAPTQERIRARLWGPGAAGSLC